MCPSIPGDDGLRRAFPSVKVTRLSVFGFRWTWCPSSAKRAASVWTRATTAALTTVWQKRTPTWSLTVTNRYCWLSLYTPSVTNRSYPQTLQNTAQTAWACAIKSRADYGPAFTQPKGPTYPLRPRGPSLRPPRGADVRLPEIVAARAVIDPLTKTRRRTVKVHDCVEASAWWDHNQPLSNIGLLT